MGSEIPESTNSPLLRLAEDTVTDAPLAVKLPLSDELVPTVTLPKLRLVGDTANVPAAVPVPESAILSRILTKWIAIESAIGLLPQCQECSSSTTRWIKKGFSVDLKPK